MGGSSLGPEVIAKSFAKELFVFDSTDPNYAHHALNGDLDKTVVVVSSKSGSTIETASQRAIFEKAFSAAGLEPRGHIVIVTDPDSPLDKEARASGFTVINADPNVGGRFSVLSAFGLTPSALIGAPVGELLAQAQAEKGHFLSNPQSVIDVAYAFAEVAGQYLAFTDNG